MKLPVKAVNKSVRVERMWSASAGRACMKREVLGAARRIERKNAGDDVRGFCSR